jgi:hypothetical protein
MVGEGSIDLRGARNVAPYAARFSDVGAGLGELPWPLSIGSRGENGVIVASGRVDWKLRIFMVGAAGFEPATSTV